MLRSKVFKESEASTSGELEVEEENVDGAVGEGEARGGYGVGDLGGEAEADGDFRTGVADGCVVVDDQHAELRKAVGVDAAAGGCWDGIAGSGIAGSGDGGGRRGCGKEFGAWSGGRERLER